MRKVLISCAMLAGACTGQEEVEAPIAPPTTETGQDLIVVGTGEDVEAEVAVTTTTEATTTTTEPPVTTTTVPILCPSLSHPAHHSPCPEEPAEYLQPVATTAVGRGTSSQLASIRACESGGNYSTDTGNGYYGAYQFHPGTWASVGGTGNPAHASPAEQDMRAQMMIDAGRRGEWPNC